MRLVLPLDAALGGRALLIGTLVAVLGGCQTREAEFAGPKQLVTPASSNAALATNPTTPESPGAGESGAANPSDDAVARVDTGAREKPANEGAPKVRPTARRPAIPGQPLEISFDDLIIGMQADVVYRPWMLSERAKEIDGQLVRIVGYIHAGVDENEKLTGEIVILRNKECKFGQGGQADHLVRVFLRKGVKAHYTDNAVEIQGELKVNPYQGPDGNTWSVYEIDGTGFKDLHRR